MKKTTMQDIADAIGISRISVWKAFHDYPGISARLKEEIFLKAKEMGYLKNNIPSIFPSDQKKKPKQPYPSSFRDRIPPSFGWILFIRLPKN